MGRFADWLDNRSGYRAFMRHALDEPVAGGARWSYVFGSALATLFVIQIATGLLLALFYSPSAKEAWGSVYFLQTQITLGWFVRGLHHWGSSAMVVLLICHLLQVFSYGAYRAPRELGWWTGLVLLFVTLGFSLTGYLLPWDQKGYWATRVVTAITGTLPVVGSWARSILVGGNDFGNLTITRFFGFHVFILPAMLMGVLAIHIVLFRRHGVTPRWNRKPEELTRTTEPFWPRQLTYDAIFAAAIFAVVTWLTISHHGAPLDAPADPASNYVARPEWYFLWLFEMLKVLPGRFEGIGILAFLLLGAVFLAALPLADRAQTRSPRDRWPHFVIASALVGVVVALTAHAKIGDSRDPQVRKQREQADVAAERAFALAAQGIPPGGADDLYLNDPAERGKRLFATQCATCHAYGGKGGDSAPDLKGFPGRAWVRGAIEDPTRPQYFGRSKVEGMEKTDATKEQLDLLTEYTLSLGGFVPEPKGGADLYEETGCQVCHARAGEDPRTGLSLNGYGTRPWIAHMVRRPDLPENYGAQNRMTVFEGKLTDTQIDDVITFLLAPPGAEQH
jgi:quinol-cytochrome oxidoreductase complex cytochrome b subunit